MACTHTYAALDIHSESLSPNEITLFLGIKPTSSEPKDPCSKYKHRRESNFWTWSTKEKSNSLNNLHHVRVIVSAFEAKAEQLAQLRQKNCTMRIFSFWSHDNQGGFGLDLEAMEKLHRLGLEIFWDIYGGSEEET
ncbi:MAG: DUF4279 domain-containing protein [Cyanobacteria bacterium P01_G01_bin.49]